MSSLVAYMVSCAKVVNAFEATPPAGLAESACAAGQPVLEPARMPLSGEARESVVAGAFAAILQAQGRMMPEVLDLPKNCLCSGIWASPAV